MAPAGLKLEMMRLQSLEAVAILPALQCIDQMPPAKTTLVSTPQSPYNVGQWEEQPD